MREWRLLPGIVIRLLRRFGYLVLALLFGFLILPTGTYMAGQRWVEPYEGSRGLGTFIASIYGAAMQGKVLALAVLLAPALVVLVWYLHGWLWRRIGAAEPGPETARQGSRPG